MAEAKDSKKDSKADAKDGKAAGGNSKKIVIFGGLIVVVAALAGAGTWFAVTKMGGSHAKKEEPKHEVEHKEEAAPIFQPLEPIVVNLSGGSESVMRIAISVQLRSEKDKEKLTAFMPKIQGDLMLLFSSKTDGELLTQEGKLALIEETKKTINRAVGGEAEAKPEDEMVKAVSFTELIIQ